MATGNHPSRKESLSERMARAMGAVDYPTDSIEQGEYWHFPERILGATKIPKKDFDPVNPFNAFFIVVLQRIHKLEALHVGDYAYRAKHVGNGDWRYGSLGEAVCLAASGHDYPTLP